MRVTSTCSMAAETIEFCVNSAINANVCLIPPHVHDGSIVIDLEMAATPEIQAFPGMLNVYGIIEKAITYSAVAKDDTATNAAITKRIPFSVYIEDCAISETGQNSVVKDWAFTSACYKERSKGLRYVDNTLTAVYYCLQEKDVVKLSVEIKDR